MIDGHKIRKARLAMHLTQIQLAKGITDRLIIGKIENNKEVPHDKLLRAILTRLNIDYTDVYFDSNQVELEKLDQLIIDGHYISAKNALPGIMKNIENEHDELHAKFLESYVSFRLRSDHYNQDLLNFRQLAAIEGKHPEDVFSFLAIDQLGMVNERLGNTKQAEAFFKQVIEFLPQIKEKANINWIAFIYRDLADHYSNIEDYGLSNKYAKQGLELASEHNSTVLADSLSYEIAQNTAKLNSWNDPKAIDYLIQAWTFANFTLNYANTKFFKHILDTHHVAVC
ncbi:helix-turn-helix transcriptional regulator [Furfurilactobacillus milii]|uniref:HTH cro/C1-type domain-containing protein n=1 Tax=Furfurilactobacillus milii TaxID=2888272 RepID=A0A6N9I0Z9_9LACO|nr:helix-turn-helix transcriptional regulator [Furfurilactobacillus milii]MYV16053.1 hypothetical protein [Furfurilactobacillus milii]